MRPVVEPVKQVLVDPFEIETECDSLPDARVAKALAGLVVRLSIETVTGFGRELPLEHAAVLHGREIIAGSPYLRCELAAPGDIALLEGLESRIAVAVELNANTIEMIEAATGGMLARPIIFHALIFDISSCGEFADFVRTRPEQRFQGGAVEALTFQRGLRQDGKADHLEDRPLGLLAGEGKPEFLRTDRLCGRHFRQGQ